MPLMSLAADSWDEGTPRSGTGNDLNSMPLATAAAASPCRSSCASSSRSRRETTLSIPDSRHDFASSAIQSPPRGRSTIPSRPRQGPGTQNTLARININQVRYPTPVGARLAAVRSHRSHVHAAPPAGGDPPRPCRPVSFSTHRAVLAQATVRDRPYFEIGIAQASRDSGWLLNAGREPPVRRT